GLFQRPGPPLLDPVAHAPEAEPRDLQPGPAEIDVIHGLILARRVRPVQARLDENCTFTPLPGGERSRARSAPGEGDRYAASHRSPPRLPIRLRRTGPFLSPPGRGVGMQATGAASCFSWSIGPDDPPLRS